MAKNYIKGSFREVKTKNGVLMNVSVLVEDLAKIANENGYANIVITERREKDSYGNTHYAYQSEFNPKEARERKAAKLTPPNFQEEVSSKKPYNKAKISEDLSKDDLPF